jgi:hypothetical protein
VRRSDADPTELGQLAARKLIEAGASALLDAAAQPPAGASA